MGRELHRQLLQLHPRPGALAVERERHPRLVGEVEGEVVGPLGAGVGAGREHRERRLLERDRDDPGPLGELLPGAQVERHPRPAPVVDLDLERHERLGVGVVGGVRMLAVAGVLAPDDVVRLDRAHRAEHLELLVADRVGRERGRRLHRHERQHLHQVGDDHVAVGTGGLVELGAALEPEGLRHVDLHVVDEVAVPDRLEEAVGEAERQDVLGRLLAEEVVDAEDLALVEDLVQPVVEPARALEVGAEGLLHHDPRLLDQPGLVELAHDVERRLGRDAQVMQEVDRPAAPGQVGLGGTDRLGERGRAGGLRHVAEQPRELVPLLRGQAAVAELVAGTARDPDELGRVDVLERGADDPRVVDEAGLPEVHETRQQLAPGQVAGGPEQHDDVSVLHAATVAVRGGSMPTRDRTPGAAARPSSATPPTPRRRRSGP